MAIKKELPVSPKPPPPQPPASPSMAEHTTAAAAIAKPLFPSSAFPHSPIYYCLHFRISLLPLHLFSQPRPLVTPRKHRQHPNHSANYLSPSLLLPFLLIAAFLLAASTIPLHPRRLSPPAREAEAAVLTESAMVPLPVRGAAENATSEEEAQFWKQPDGMGYRPCVRFSLGYRKASGRVVREQRRFLVVEASGGLNQQRNQIVDAVVIARILGAALVVPVLKVNVIWGDESEFSEIFEVDHFKRTLQSDVRVVSSLPSSHQMVRSSTIGGQIPFNASPLWIRRRLLKHLNKVGVLVLKGLDSKLSKTLPPDLQKLRCKVAFHALRFAAPIRALGDALARRMWEEGPYIAVHLRLEKDVWVRTGCLPGLGPEHDDAIIAERDAHPELLTGRLSMSQDRRKLAGLCPLNAREVARLLTALGAPRNARVYLAGGEPFGGGAALRPLMAEFPNSVGKEELARDGELEAYRKKPSALAAIDFIVSLSSDVFLPSHGGNMGKALQGYRAYTGHRKSVRPNKRGAAPLLGNSSVSDAEVSAAVRRLHRDSLGQPELRKGGDVIAHPARECMCRSRRVFFQ